MTRDLSPIHPELRIAIKFLPRFSVKRWSLPLIRWLTSLVPLPKMPAGTKIKEFHIQDKEGKGTIRLRIYQPETMVTPLPALFWMHGGGYLFGWMEMDDANLCGFVRDLGIVIVSVDYRFAPEYPFPLPLDDCYAGLKWMYDHAGELGINTARIAVGGASAGGGLAAALVQLAHDRGEIHPLFQLLVYPMLDDRTVLREEISHRDLLTWTPESNHLGWESYLQQPAGAEKVPPYAVPSRREDLAGLPPAWIGVGTLDLFYEEDLAYAGRLKQYGVECELVVVPGAFHGFDTRSFEIPVIHEFRRSQIEALRKVLFI